MEFPSEWATGLTVPLHKEGDKKNHENYWKIKILPLLGKLFEILVINRLTFMKESLRLKDPYNGGFKKGSMTSDNMFILLDSVQNASALKQPLYVCFVDFKRAFDTVNREMMFYRVVKTGIDGTRYVYKN